MDFPLFLALVLSFMTFIIYLLPRWHRKRTIEIPFLNIHISVVGSFRQWTLRVLFFLIYSIIFLLVLREVYVTRAGCETTDDIHLLTLATQSRALRLLDQINVPVWADHETLGDYLYTNYGLPKWKSTITFSTLWTDDKGLTHIRNILETNSDNTSTGLWTHWLSSTSTLRIGFHGTTTVYMDLVFWYDQYDSETKNRFLMTPSPIFDFPLVHYYEIFPLQQRTPREYPTSSPPDHSSNNIILQPIQINIPNSAHQLAMRTWGDLAKEGDFRKTPTRSICMENLLFLRWISISSNFSPQVLQEFTFMGVTI